MSQSMMKNNLMDDLEYYNMAVDLEKHPEAWLYTIYSHRGPGKTYSTLRYMYENRIKIVYMKRTIEDVDILCTDTGTDVEMDLSPYKPLNRDFGWNIQPVLIKKGLGGFYESNEKGEPTGSPVAYVLAMSAISKYKGFDLSDCDYIVFDEFIPPVGERLNRKEGDLLMELYMTVSRDRLKRGKPMLKLIMLANTSQISSPITNSLELTDIMAEMEATGEAETLFNGMYLHHLIEPKFQIIPPDDPVRKALGQTAWGQMAFDGKFSYNDFSNVRKQSIKGMQPFIQLHYKTHDYFIYYREYDQSYYMCESRQKCPLYYDLNRENQQIKFYLDYQIDLKYACVDDRMKFQKYSMYDLIINYKNFCAT